MKERRYPTKEQQQQLTNQIRGALVRDNPQSTRHVYYLMTNPRLPESVEKTDQGYRRVQRLVLKMRREGVIPYAWVTDATRRGYHVDTFVGAGDFLDRMHALYRADAWADCRELVEVWTESRSLGGVLEDDCDRLAVSLYPCGGFSSATLAFQAVEDWNRASGKDRVVVIYVGDYDPAGTLIDKHLLRELEQHSPLPIEFRRLAINPEQIEEYDLPTKPRKPGDRRRPDITVSVEGEAMPASTMRALVCEAVESYLPKGRLESLKVVEEDERWGMSRLAEYLGDKGLDSTLDELGL